MQYKFTLPEKQTFAAEDLLGFAYSNAQDNADMESLHLIIDGHSGKATTGESSRVYLVLIGDGEFVIEGEVTSVQKGDVIMLPKNTDYEYQGSMELFEVNTPSYISK